MVRKKNVVSLIVIIVLGSILTLSIMFFVFSVMRSLMIDGEIAKKVKVIERYVQRSKMPITKDSIAYLLDQREKLKSVDARLKLGFTSPLTEELTDEDVDPLEFKERLHQVQKKVREEAKMQGMGLPESLGFDTYEKVVPDTAIIPFLTRRLSILEEVVYIMVISGVDELKKISFNEIGAEGLNAEDLTARMEQAARMGQAGRDAMAMAGLGAEEQKAFKEMLEAGTENEIRLSVSLDCLQESFVDFLYNMRMSPYFFVVDEVEVDRIRKTGPGAEVAPGEGIRVGLRIRVMVLN